jgi:hypothetical protein
MYHAVSQPIGTPEKELCAYASTKYIVIKTATKMYAKKGMT